MTYMAPFCSQQLAARFEPMVWYVSRSSSRRRSDCTHSKTGRKVQLIDWIVYFVYLFSYAESGPTYQDPILSLAAGSRVAVTVAFIFAIIHSTYRLPAFHAENERLLWFSWVSSGLVWSGPLMWECLLALWPNRIQIYIWTYITNMWRNWIYIEKPQCKYIAK